MFSPSLPTPRSKVAWTVGNLLITIGLYLLLYLGGVQAQIEYYRRAARGDSDLPPPTVARFITSPDEVTSSMPDLFTIPVLNRAASPDDTANGSSDVLHRSTVSRIMIPTIEVDAKVIEVAWQLQTLEDGTTVSIWQVAEYAVGHHRGSTNPGDGSNIVLAGHVGGYGKVFYHLFDVEPGDTVMLYSDGQQYLYVVQETLLVDEANATPAQRAANARFIEPTDEEVVTLVTCWPPQGDAAFHQRVIVRAVPYGATPAAPVQQHEHPGHGTAR